MGFSEKDAGLIEQWSNVGHDPLSLLLRITGDERSGLFEAYFAGLRKLAPNLRADIERLDSADEPPAIVAGGIFCYYALPEGKELQPFLDVLSGPSPGGHPDPDASIRARLEPVDMPADLKVFITLQCGFCPQVVRQISCLPFLNPLVRLTVIDGILFPEMSQRDGIRSAPTVVLDGKLRWTGSVDLAEIVDAIVHRDATHLSASALEGLLKEGNASLLARMMLKEGRIFQAFPDLAFSTDWPVRLGAMVVVEEIAERNVDFAEIILKLLWERLESAEERVKCDIVFLIGTVGGREWIPRLEELSKGAIGVELQEALGEALEELGGRLAGR
jgi:hypothetical protein